jgi:hypothetical protein
MTTETTTTAAGAGQDLAAEKINQLRELFADAPEVGKKALENVLDAAGELAGPGGAARRAHRFAGRRQPRQHGPADVPPGTGHQNGHGASSFRRAGGAGRTWNTATWPAAAAKASGSGLVVMPARANIGAPLGTSRG